MRAGRCGARCRGIGRAAPRDPVLPRDAVGATPVMPLLLLADSRLPSGGHGHSGGIEALVDWGLVASTDDLALFLAGRLRTGGRVVAAAAAAACALARG